MRRYKHIADVQKLMWIPERIRNIGIVAHVDHGKTTLTDSLVAASGIISFELAGEQLFTDFLEIEQQRGITIQTSAVSLAHNLDGEEYIINLLDTPGHVDFSGDVTRALRAIDGVIVVVDAVEGVMVQTETVLRQALRERARPVLFINKVDRLIDEIRLTPDEMQMRFIKIISKFNQLIKRFAPKDMADKWQVNVENGSVAFGSAKEKWALSIPQMKKKNITFKDIINAYKTGAQSELAKKSPIYEVILDMVVRHLPNPKQAQADRVPVIWKGDPDSELGKDMISCNPNGKICMVITDIIVDEHAGVISTGRIFSGTLEKGKAVRLVNAGQEARIQQVGIYMGPDRVIVDKVPAGNIAAIIGMKEAYVGETLVEVGVEGKGFEELRYVSEPVVTVAVEPKNFQDLPRLVNALKNISREDPNVKIKINEETGEYLVSGMGELHLEIVQYKLKEAGLEVTASEPIVVYRETITKKAGPVEGKSPNKHNRFLISVEPLEPEVIKAIEEGKIFDNQDRKERASILRELGWEADAAKGVMSIKGPNVLVDITKGVQYMREVEDYILEAFKEVTDEGPLMREPTRGLKVLIVDAQLHEDSVHRGPAQIIPAVRRATQAAILMANVTVLEPILRMEVRVPQEFLGGVTRVIQGRRGKIITMESEEDLAIIKATLPVANSFGLAAEMRSETEGRAIWGTEFDRFEPLPHELAEQVIRDTRKRKGLKLEPPKPEDFMD
ncbi:MAG: elongation factor EF-2 [Hadesarchaea archaeon YNP_N21]|jgi:elongation factor 2|nr:MAG: elongation factor EF-2 [Hadesarchaea archaeon YNP_N21]